MRARLLTLGLVPSLCVMVGVVVLACVGAGVASAGARAAEPCPNEQIRAQEVYALRLPDCRAYEQVTPVDKDATNPTGATNEVQASLAGDRITYLAPAGIPGGVGSSNYPTFLASRSGGSSPNWSSQGLLPPSPSGFSDTILGWSEDLSTVVSKAVFAGEEQGLGVYTEDTPTGAYQLVAGPLTGAFYTSIDSAGFSADGSHMIFETTRQLLPQAAEGENNLYESYDGKLTLAGVLPASEGGGAPPEGSFAGPYNWVGGETESGGSREAYYTQNTISADGSRVFFTAGGTGQLYMRENGTSTVRISASQRTSPDPNGPRPAAFMAASPGGSEVYFTTCEKLTNDSTAVSNTEPSCTNTSQGQDLYAYDVATGALSDLTVDQTAGDPLGAAVQGVLGQGESSEGGSYVYFVANGVLAVGASPGNCHGVHFEGTCNLYMWHDGTVRLIAELNAGRSAHSTSNGLGSLAWYPRFSAEDQYEKMSRVTPDGKTLLFASNRQLTAYDSAGYSQFYRYDAVNGDLTCTTCSPRATASTGEPTLQSMGTTSEPITPTAFLTRNLSADGSQVFFESEEALLPQDTDGVKDVYEWEAEGAGSCQSSSESYSQASGGCLYLISTGRNAQPSYFADASASGEDVFFFTSQPLVGQDQDQLIDLYDARVNGGVAAQNASPPPPCEGEACRGTESSAPAFGAPSSTTLAGVGNLAPPPVLASAPSKVVPKSVMRAQKLAKALKVCKKKPKKRQGSCEAQAKKRYGKSSKARKSIRVRKSHKGAK
ncbi:MAG TPA: hypothetical protein VIJ66_06910 [Solirubrobacteraceae bacterium]